MAEEDTWIDARVLEWHREVRKRSEGARIDVNLGMPMAYYRKWQEKTPEYILGLDEVGAGPLAGPVTVAAVLAPREWDMVGLRDSKQVKAQVPQLAPVIQQRATVWVIRSFEAHVVDRWGLSDTLRVLFEECIESIREQYPDIFDQTLIVLDGARRARHVDHAIFPKADDIVKHVAAASIIAKNNRDKYMQEQVHPRYPQYGFDTNVGYGSKKHYAALAKYGPCDVHRKTFLSSKEEVVT